MARRSVFKEPIKYGLGCGLVAFLSMYYAGVDKKTYYIDFGVLCNQMRKTVLAPHHLILSLAHWQVTWLETLHSAHNSRHSN